MTTDPPACPTCAQPMTYAGECQSYTRGPDGGMLIRRIGLHWACECGARVSDYETEKASCERLA